MSGVTVVGLDRVAQTLRDAGDQLGDLTETHQKIGDMVWTKARPSMPRKTGRMIASGRVTAGPRETTITITAPYARPVLFGAPRAGIRPATSTPLLVAQNMTPQIVELVTEAADAACATVKGA